MNVIVGFHFSGLCSLNGSIYCIGGTYGQSGSKNCFKLAADESKWERIAPLQLGKIPGIQLYHSEYRIFNISLLIQFQVGPKLVSPRSKAKFGSWVAATPGIQLLQ